MIECDIFGYGEDDGAGGRGSGTNVINDIGADNKDDYNKNDSYDNVMIVLNM